MRRDLDSWLLVLGLLTVVRGLNPTRSSEENATSFMKDVTTEGTQSTWDGDIPAINQGLIPEESPENSFLVEGDIIKASPFQMFSAASFKWPKKNGIVEIPYIFSSKYDQPSREIILKAFSDFEHLTCIRFVPRTKQKDFVSIIPMSGCFSSVGHSGGMQVTSLAPFCLQKGKGIVLHELMHVLGFWHEHSRADRDRYIHISWQEIRPGFEINFIKSQNTNMLVPYDYTSVMHYGRYAFSKNGNTTIEPLAGPDIPIGQRWNLSISDIVRINRLYECTRTVKNPGLHQNLGLNDFIVPDEKKLLPKKAISSLKAVSQREARHGVPPYYWSVSSHSDLLLGKEVTINTRPTWLITDSSPGAAHPPELVSPSEAVPWESTKNTPIRPVLSTSVPLLKVLPRGKMNNFLLPKLLPKTHNKILVEMGRRGGRPSTLILGRGAWSESTFPLPSENASFPLEFQSYSPDWGAETESTMVDIQTSHPRLGSIPGQSQRCQLCGQKKMDSAPIAEGVVLLSGGRGLLWRLLKALTLTSTSGNLPAIRGVRAWDLGPRDQFFTAKLKGDIALPKTPSVVFPAHGTQNPEAPEELAQVLMEGGKEEADSLEGEKLLKLLSFEDVTGGPDELIRHKPSESTSQNGSWPSWESKLRKLDKAILEQPRRDSSSKVQVILGELGLLHTLPTVTSQTLSSSRVAPVLFLKPWSNKILAQRKSPLLSAFTQTSHPNHLMEDMTSNHFIFSVLPRKTQYLGTETSDEAFQRSGGTHSEVRTTTVDGKEARQAGSPSVVGSMFREGELADPVVSVNSILSLEDSGNQKPHPPGRREQGGPGEAGKKWIPSFTPLRTCPFGGIQLYLGGSMIPLLPVEPERLPMAYKSKGRWMLQAGGVKKKVASFLSWTSNSSNVTLRYLVHPYQSLEDPQSQTFPFAEAKPEIPRHQRVPDPEFDEAGSMLLRNPSGLLSLVPLWECGTLSRVRDMVYFLEPEAMEKDYPSAFGENTTSAIEALVLPSQAFKTQTPNPVGSQKDKGRGQLGNTSASLIQTMAHSVRDKVEQTLEQELGTSKELGGRDPKFPPLKLDFNALPLRNPFLGISDAKTLPALGTQTSNWARGTLSPLAVSEVGPEPVEWLLDTGTTWTPTFHRELRVNEGPPEGRLKIQAHSKLLFLGPLLPLTGPVIEPQISGSPSLWKPHTEKGREEEKTSPPNPSRTGEGNVPLTDYFNPRDPFSENLFHHIAWVRRQGVQSRSTDGEEHISQFLSHGSLSSGGRKVSSKSFTTLGVEREDEKVRNVVGKSRSLAVSSAVDTGRTKSALSQLHVVNLTSLLERLKPIKSWLHNSQEGKGEPGFLSSGDMTSSLGKISDSSMRTPSFFPSHSPKPFLSSFPSSSFPFSSSSPSLSPFTFSPLPQHLAISRIAKLSTTASILRKAIIRRRHQKHQQPENQKSDFFLDLGKDNIGHPDSRTLPTPQQFWFCDQAEQGRGCAQNQEDLASEESSGNIHSQILELSSLPIPVWWEPVSLVRLRAQRQSSELEATSGDSWLCLNGRCLKVILQDLALSQELKTTGAKSLLARVLFSRSKPLQLGVSGSSSSKEVQVPQVGVGSPQLPPHTKPFHPDWSTQSPIVEPHSMDNLSSRPTLPGTGTDPWPSDWFCDFEIDLCGWQKNGTGADWVLTQDQKNQPSSVGLPLEKSCHFPGGNHLSLQNQTSPHTVPKAVLISPIFHGARWVRFWYGPLQPGMGTISVYVYSRAQFRWRLIWSSVGHWSSSWSWVERKLWASRKIQVMVEGVQGPEDGAPVSIDNLSVSSHQWPKEGTKYLCHSFKKKTLNKT